MKKIAVLARVRHHLASGEKPGGYTPYPGVLHDIATDESVDWREEVYKILRNSPEGARVTISLEVTPPPADLDPDDYWVLVKPHTYRHVRDKGEGEE